MGHLYNLGHVINDYDTKKGKRISNILYILNFVFILLYVLGTYPFAEPYLDTIYIVEYIISIIFLVELIGRMVYARHTESNSIINLYTVSDSLAIIPVLLSPILVTVGLGFFRVFYSLRVIRFIRISLENNRIFNYNVQPEQVDRAKIILTILLIFFITAGAFFEVEGGVNPKVNNFGDALYYSIVAVSTAGFGDIIPVTVLGRLITMIGLLVAVILIPVQIAQARTITHTENNNQCHKCGLQDHEDDARYCKRCGEKIVKD